MEILIACLGTLVLIEFLVILVLIDRAKKRISMEDMATIATEISAKSHLSYDTVMQSLIGLNNAYGERLRK